MLVNFDCSNRTRRLSHTFGRDLAAKQNGNYTNWEPPTCRPATNLTLRIFKTLPIRFVLITRVIVLLKQTKSKLASEFLVSLSLCSAPA